MSKQQRVVVTGASSGLGVALARELARRGHHLVLTARSDAPMQVLAEELRRLHGIEVAVEPLDLAQPTGPADLMARLDAQGFEPHVLVNNAGFGHSGAFLDQPLDRLRAMLQLDLVSLTELTYLVGHRMAARNRGRIMLVGSMAAFQPVATMAAYAAAKAYVLSFGEALHAELTPDVVVTVLSPGLMDTGFAKAASFAMPASLRRTQLLPAEVARIGLDAMFAGKSGVIAGRLNRIMALSSRFTSRRFAARAMANFGQSKSHR